MADEFMSAYDNQAVVTLLGLDERADSRTVARRQAVAAEDPYAYVGSRMPISTQVSVFFFGGRGGWVRAHS